MTIKVEIKSTSVQKIEGTSSKNGRAYSFCKQEAWFFNGRDPYPTKIELTVNDPSKAYPVGSYSIAPDSIFVDRNNRLAVAPILIPIATGAAEYKAASGGK